MNFSTPPANPPELPDDLLSATLGLLLTAIGQLFPHRGCSELSFAFESGHGGPGIRIAAITDSEGCIILEMQRILDWRAGSGPCLGDLLEAAAGLHLDANFPAWCDGAGSTGMLLLTLLRQPDGSVGVRPRGIAWTRPPAQGGPLLPG